jgi:hypothetical protein
MKLTTSLLTVGALLMLPGGAVAQDCAAWFQSNAPKWEEPQDTRMALFEPDCYAWRLFVALNWPADVAAKTADPTASFGVNAPVVWETWRNASREAPDTVFPKDGSDPGPWLDAAIVALGPDRFEAADEGPLQLAALIETLEAAGGPALPFDPQAAGLPRNETRLNKETYEFVRAEELFNIEGQVAKFNAGAETISFPAMAKEVKAQWRVITEADKPRYHWVEAQGAQGMQIYGLTALHITTKDLPNWLWATFEHIDNKTAQPGDATHPSGEGWLLPSADRFACTDAPYDCEAIPQGIGLEGTPWANYRLRGVQIDFFDSTGRETRLANSQPERFFQTSSSCITCHALASINAAGERLEFFSPAGEGPVGRPMGWVNGAPAGFRDENGVQQFTQLDFVWSLFRASSKQ